MAKIWPVDSARPDETVIAKAADIVRQGGVVVIPTQGLYGLSADPFNEEAVQRIFKVKGRPAGKALLLLIENMDALFQVAIPPNAMAVYLMHSFWPGGVTFVLNARQELPSTLTAGTGKIGVRLVAHPVAAALIRAAGMPLTGTSANISGSGGCAAVDQIDANLLNGVNGVLDAGPLADGPGSTVVDVTGAFPKILREGAVSARKIMGSYKAFEAGNVSLT